MVELGVIGPFLTDIGIILILAVVFAFIAKYFDQPLISAYVLAGILIGPSAFDLITNMDLIEIFAELGVAFLLFTVGLEIDLSKLNKIKRSIILLAAVEMTALFTVGYFLMYFLGYSSLTSIYIGLIITFSSTAVLIKLLMDLNELDSMHGRLTLGTLLIQDIVVVLALAILPIITDATNNIFIELIEALSVATVIIITAFLLNKYIINHVLNFIKDSDELLFLTSIATLFGFLVASNQAGLSTAVGGFIAGITLANYPFNIKIATKATPMRDFFLTIFFVYIGTLIEIKNLIEILLPLIILLIIVIAFKPLVIYLVTHKLGFGNKTSFKTGLGLGQISEFSMVIAILGYNLGQLSQEILSTTALLLVISTTITSYVFNYVEKLFDEFEKHLLPEKNQSYCAQECYQTDHIVIFGGSLLGERILHFLEEDDYVLVDIDPEIIDRYEKKGIAVVYGDAKEKKTLERANADKARLIISTITEDDTNQLLMNNLSETNKEVKKIFSATSFKSALDLYKRGVDFVIHPNLLAAKEAADRIKKIYHGEEIRDFRKEHIEILEKELKKKPISVQGELEKEDILDDLNDFK